MASSFQLVERNGLAGQQPLDLGRPELSPLGALQPRRLACVTMYAGPHPCRFALFIDVVAAYPAANLVTLGFGCLTAILRLGSPPPRKLNQGRALGDANDVLARANRFPGSCLTLDDFRCSPH
jgi:hypothetical protein